MKRFLYCETTYGGMQTHTFVHAPELSFLYGWMDQHCRHVDELLSSWMEDAAVGQMHEHRLGVCIRLADEE